MWWWTCLGTLKHIPLYVTERPCIFIMSFLQNFDRKLKNYYTKYDKVQNDNPILYDSITFYESPFHLKGVFSKNLEKRVHVYFPRMQGNRSYLGKQKNMEKWRSYNWQKWWCLVSSASMVMTGERSKQAMGTPTCSNLIW